jgi:hypothetical protein
MKMGIKEFRERIAEVSAGDEVVIVTHRGKRVGRYIPERLHRPARNVDLEKWVIQGEESSRRWRVVTPDWQERLRAAGVPDEEIAELEAMDRCS